VTRRLALLCATLLVGGASLAACGSDADPSADSSAAAGGASASASTSASAWPDFDPCDGLDAGPVSRALGWKLKVDRGTKANPRCALVPVKKGGPTYQLNYQWFPDGLEAAFDTIKIPAGTVSRPKVPGTDAVRLIEQPSKSAYAVTGFIQNGALVQNLNGLALKPYDAAKVRKAALVLLGEMSANAPLSAVKSPASSPSASPSS
jgi:hypothetical protein